MPRRPTRRTRGAGYQTSQQYFNPDILAPVGPDAASIQPTDTVIRPVMNSTFKVGGRRGGRRSGRRSGRATRKTRRSSRRANRRVGGFSPSVMGSFLQNAQTAIVPLALYSAYHLMPKKSRNVSKRR